MHEFYSSPVFEEKFTYTGTDLGAVWSKEKTCFRLWAPTAKSVSIRLYKTGNPNAEDLINTISMDADIQGTWRICIDGNWNGVYYTYLVELEDKIVEACDPYARTTGVNGQRAMILDLHSTDPNGWERDSDPHAGNGITDAVIYELHVRDLSMHHSSGIAHKGKFLGLTEHGTSIGKHCTGIDHIKNLGITHIHLLPVYDFGSVDETRTDQFNWGYDPMNFNVPEGSYATDPYHGEVRVREMKQMVKSLHDAGLSVIMDVVYNHVYQHEAFCFNQIVPGYFTRADAKGNLSNGSCCGNDTASERSMVRKYIVDSVKYWADEYHIDGFRFDLVGLIDTRTIQEIIETVHRTHPNVLFYGEGWSMQTALTKSGYALTTQNNANLVPGFSFFSDTVRDLLRGTIFSNTSPGFASGAAVSKETLENCFLGMPGWATEPYQSVNYVSCHDNNTLFDRIVLATPEESRENHIRMNRLAAAFTILAQGVPFMQAGEELFRTKPARGGKFNENSYKSPDRVNSIKWDTLKKTEYRTNRDYYKGLIAFRKKHPALRLTTQEQVLKQVRPLPNQSPFVAAFLVEEGDSRIYIAFNADKKAETLVLPDGKWHTCVLDEKASETPFETVVGSIQIPPISTVVLVQDKAGLPIDVVAALIWEKDKFLICQRPTTKARGMLWEFVGGKVESGETFPQALQRECAEELAITVDVGKQFMQVIHEYPDILIRLTLFHCTIPTGYPQALEHNDIRWIHPGQIDDYQFCPADKDILKRIKQVYGNKEPL